MAGQSVEVNRRLGHSFDREFAVVVAGAGSAGCVLASRLTDNARPAIFNAYRLPRVSPIFEACCRICHATVR